MRCRILSVLFTTFLTFSFASQSAAESSENLTLSGIATYWSFNHEIYVASLWLEKTASSPEAIHALAGNKQMKLKVTGNKWRQRNFAKTWARAIIISNDDAFQSKFGKEINTFSNMLEGSLLYGDTIDINLLENKTVTVQVNNTTLFKTNKPEFFDGLLNVWIGNKPPSTEFKQAILKIDKSIPETKNDLARFERIVPGNPASRKKEVAGWVAVSAPKKIIKAKPKPKPIAKKVTAPSPIAAPTVAPISTIPATTKVVKSDAEVIATPIAAPTPSIKKQESTPASMEAQTAETQPSISAANPISETPISIAPISKTPAVAIETQTKEPSAPTTTELSAPEAQAATVEAQTTSKELLETTTDTQIIEAQAVIEEAPAPESEAQPAMAETQIQEVEAQPAIVENQIPASAEALNEATPKTPEAIDTAAPINHSAPTPTPIITHQDETTQNSAAPIAQQPNEEAIAETEEASTAALTEPEESTPAETLDPQQQLAADIKAAKAELASQPQVNINELIAETEAAESHFDDLISQLETETQDEVASTESQ